MSWGDADEEESTESSREERENDKEGEDDTTDDDTTDEEDDLDTRGDKPEAEQKGPQKSTTEEEEEETSSSNDEEGGRGDEEGGEEDGEEVVAEVTPPAKKKASKKKATGSSEKATPESTEKASVSKAASTAKTARRASTSSGKKSIIQMVHDSIIAMKDRTGSSQIAIQKYILSNYPEVTIAKMKSRLLLSLKSGVASKRFIKVKASYKIHPDFLKKQRKQTNKQKMAKRAAAKKKADAEKKKEEPKLTPAQIAAQKERDRQEAIRKARAERIKRRRFPMEDLALIKEDKELGVSVSLPSRPNLPLVFSSFLPAANSKSDSTGSGLWEDVLHVYHFFRGDIGWAQQLECQSKLYVVAPFTLQQWVNAVEQIVCGNSKQSRMLPPLVNHLFCVALQYLCRDLPKLQVGLAPSSWSEILLLYMDAMERYATTDASLVASGQRSILRGQPIDADYLLGATEAPREEVAGANPEAEASLYFSDELVRKAHCKLLSQDPWLLSAEEVMGLLRCIVDDLLGNLPMLQDMMDRRLTESHELLKKKRSADASVRKVQMALKNKQDASSKPEKGNGKSENGKTNSGRFEDSNDKGNNEENDPPGGDVGDELTKADAAIKSATSKPAKTKKGTATLSSKTITALTKDLDAAKKAQQRANQDLDRFSRSGRVRTEPIGIDRNFNAVYSFPNDPQCLYIRQKGGLARPSGSSNNSWDVPLEFRTHKTVWYVLNKKSTFDAYLESLDVRGKREAALHAAMQPLRRHLFDDIKVKSAQNAALREKEDLHRRLENAKLKCEVGRRSGRLAGKAEEEFTMLQAEIDALQRSMRGEDEPKPVDWVDITGLELLRRFDRHDIFQQCPQEQEVVTQLKRRATTRRDAQKQQRLEQEQLEAANQDGPALEKLRCSELCCSDDTREGVVGMVVSLLLDLEERCQELSEWDLGDVHRAAWIDRLEACVSAWHAASPLILVPSNHPEAASGETFDQDSDDAVESKDTTPSGTTKRKLHSSSSDVDKRRRVEESSSSPSRDTGLSVSQILAMLKQPLFELENRVFDMTGLAMASRDADEADENMSTSEVDEEAKQEQLQSAWKKIANRLHRLPAKAHVKIRQIVVEAIAAARKAQLAAVVAELRSALLLFHPDAAGDCKVATLKILEKHGGWDEIDDGDDEEEEGVEEEEEVTKVEAEETGLSSVLCAEAVILNSSLDGQEDASRADWINAVKKTRTISKFSSLVVAFVNKASEKLQKLESESEALAAVMEAWEKEAGKKRKTNRKDVAEPSEVWTDVRFTDEFCFAKVENYPWWPAKKCEAKDEELSASLENLGRTLVSLVGESGGLRVVQTAEDLLPFSENHPTEDVSDHTKDIRTQLDECMAMARRIVRGKQKKASKASKKKRESLPRSTRSSEFKEEKKLAT